MSVDEVTQATVTIGGGSVEYDMGEAIIGINELIASLQRARDDGAKFVVGLSGNYRGPRWSKITEPEWIGDDDF